jgi:hypothetical protein
MISTMMVTSNTVKFTNMPLTLKTNIEMLNVHTKVILLVNTKNVNLVNVLFGRIVLKF